MLESFGYEWSPMTFALKTQTNLEAAASRLELAYCSWEGTWEAFENEVKRKGTSSEKEVLRLWPNEFKASVVERNKRVIRWQDKRLGTYLDRMDKLTEAKKSVVTRNADGSTQVEEVDDPTVQLNALKFMICKIEGNDPERGPCNPNQVPTIPLEKAVVESLKSIGLRLSDHRAEQSVEFRSGVGEDTLPA